MSRKIKWTSVFLLLVAVLALASFAGADSPTESPSSYSPVENSAIHIQAIDGEALYRKLCAQCHGAEGKSPTEIVDLLRPSPPDLAAPEDESKRSLDYIEDRIRSGSSKNMMHYKGRLDAEQARAIAKFVRTLQR